VVRAEGLLANLERARVERPGALEVAAKQIEDGRLLTAVPSR
jgi:hypothetical protein